MHTTGPFNQNYIKEFYAPPPQKVYCSDPNKSLSLWRLRRGDIMSIKSLKLLLFFGQGDIFDDRSLHGKNFPDWKCEKKHPPNLLVFEVETFPWQISMGPKHKIENKSQIQVLNFTNHLKTPQNFVLLCESVFFANIWIRKRRSTDILVKKNGDLFCYDCCSGSKQGGNMFIMMIWQSLNKALHL